MKLRLWLLSALILCPFVALAYVGVRAAVATRRAFADLNTSLATLTEAVRLEGAPFAYGVQWHPEFLAASPEPGLLDPAVLLRAFLDEVRARRT